MEGRGPQLGAIHPLPNALYNGALQLPGKIGGYRGLKPRSFIHCGYYPESSYHSFKQSGPFI